ncbi:PREDICTED: probable transcriptional regulatory protein Pmob_0807 isoform X2 [Polistes dominula]|nr:PREDICTED: probable transcriptional regulatory protein Pmob_0807 isoform X2 [Polistes dominula]
MPMSTINNILNKIDGSKDKTQSILLQIQGPKNCVMVLKIVSDNVADTKMHLNSILKKINAKTSQGTINSFFDYNGIIITEAKSTLETAMEDAINVGAIDIEEIVEDENKYYKFKCDPQLLLKITNQLKNLDYSIIDAKEELIPLSCMKLSDEDLQVVKSAQERLFKLDEIEEIYDNIDHNNL